MPRRMYSAPTPFGPSSLWPASASRSQLRASTSIGSQAAPATASTTNRQPLRALLADDGADLGHRLEGPDLVVRELDRDDGRPLVDRRSHVVRIDAPVAVDGQLDDLEPELLELLQRVEYGVVLDRARHDPVALGLCPPRRRPSAQG